MIRKLQSKRLIVHLEPIISGSLNGITISIEWRIGICMSTQKKLLPTTWDTWITGGIMKIRLGH